MAPAPQLGEYVSLGKVESQLKTHSLVENICLYGDPYRKRTVAIAVPSQEHLKALAKTIGIHSGSLEELCSSFKVYYLYVVLGPKLLLVMGCVKLVEKLCSPACSG